MKLFHDREPTYDDGETEQPSASGRTVHVFVWS